MSCEKKLKADSQFTIVTTSSSSELSFLIWLPIYLILFILLEVPAALLPWPGLVAGRNSNINMRRDGEAERRADRLQVDVLDVVDVLQRVGLVGADVGLVRFLGTQVEVIVLRD